MGGNKARHQTKEEEERVKLSVDAREKTLRFAKALLQVLGEDKNLRDEAIEKFLGTTQDQITILSTDFPFYQRSQAIYALNVFPERSKHCKIIRVVNMTENGERPPSYERIRVTRKKRLSLLTLGEFLLEWKGTKLVLELYFCGYTRRAKIYSKDIDVANGFQDAFGKFMKKKNLLKGERLLFLPHDEIELLRYPKLGWSDVILKPELIESINLNIVFPLSNEKACVKKGIPWRRGVLIGGIAGTGKTQICRILCNVLPDDVTIIWATPKALGESEKVQQLFEAARYFSPTLIVIEDIDFIGTSRDFVQNPILGELLTQLDGNDPNHGIFVIATTNRPQYLDEALANRPSRFDVKLEFSLPNEPQRMQLVKLFTKAMKLSESIDCEKIAAMSDKLTGAHIREIFIYAQLKALKCNSKQIRVEDIAERIQQYKKDERIKRMPTEDKSRMYRK